MTEHTPVPPIALAGDLNWRTELSRIADDYQPDGINAILALEEMRQALRELLESTACACGVSCQDKGEGNCRYTAPSGALFEIDVEFVKNPVHGGFHIRKWDARGELSEGKFRFYAAPTPVPAALSDDQAARVFSCAKEWTDEWSEREFAGTGTKPSAQRVNSMFVHSVAGMIAAPTPSASSVPTERQAFETFVTDLIMEARGTEPDFSLDDGSGNHYEDAHINNMWTAWKERARIAAPPASPAPSVLPELTDAELIELGRCFGINGPALGMRNLASTVTLGMNKERLSALLQANGATK